MFMDKVIDGVVIYMRDLEWFLYFVYYEEF